MSCETFTSTHWHTPTTLLLVTYKNLGDFPLQSVGVKIPPFLLSLAGSVTKSPANLQIQSAEEVQGEKNGLPAVRGLW